MNHRSSSSSSSSHGKRKRSRHEEKRQKNSRYKATDGRYIDASEVMPGDLSSADDWHMTDQTEDDDIRRAINASISAENQKIVQQQDEEHALSMAIDLSKEMEKQRQKNEAEEKLKLEKIQADRNVKRKEDLIRQFPNEPAPDNRNAICLRLSLPTGTFSRRFEKSNPVWVLFVWAQLQDPRCFDCKLFQIVLPSNDRLSSNDLSIDATLESLHLDRCTLRVVIVDE